jgi:sigma-54 dependent transcriptional regulator
MPLLELPNHRDLALSIRATALACEDPASRELLERIELIAPSGANVLVIGETGTGKELVARHVHQLSKYREGPFVAVNCGALTENLVEAELFGHERGAFTGATNAKAGWFETANGGTLFLDEIGDLPLGMQVKLLRVLQEREVTRVGSREPVKVDLRLIAATNVNLAEAVHAGRFREDLFYRLNVATLALPPLRRRPGDILPLTHHFLTLYAKRLGIGIVRLSDDAADALVRHEWPGNIRELENVVHHALLVCRDNVVEVADLHLGRLQPRDSAERVPEHSQALELALQDLFDRSIPGLYEHIDRRLTLAAFRYCENNQLQTAKMLGISRNILRAKLKRFGAIGDRTLRSADLPPQEGDLPLSIPSRQLLPHASGNY